MQPSREQVLARERRWALPVALATLAAVGLLVAANIVVGAVSGDGDAEVLRSVHENGSAVTLSAAMQAVAFLLLVAPLVYLFRAAQARSPRVRGQLIGLIVAAPLFLATAAVLTAVSTTDAASDFVAANPPGEVAPGVAERRAEDAIADAPARSLATGFGLGGRLGLAFALLYGCLWAMRSGLLSRFWGSLGMAMGVAALLLLVQFTLVWFLYFALLVAGWVPGGRPPAWAAGEAIPWPTPGEKAAAELGADDADGPEDDPDSPPRKRKQRD